jgi:catechol 2,3-dioxygenase-like lactoylglutathione lyase family enzyme
MITGAHVLLYTTDPDADRRFFRDILGFDSVDAGHGWLIFALPPSELALHPSDGHSATQTGDGATSASAASLYLMCDDVRETVQRLQAQGVACGPLAEERWGVRTTLRLPSGTELGLYHPSHSTALARARH